MGATSDAAETVGAAIISGIGGVLVAGIGAWAVVHVGRRKEKPTGPSMTDRVFDDLMDRIDSLEKQLSTSQDRARHWEVEAARLKAEIASAKKQRTSDGLLISRLRARVDAFERRASND